MSAADAQSALQGSLKPLTPRLRAMMSPLALFVFVSVGLVSPYLYERAALQERQLEANLMAQALSKVYGQLAARTPQLWLYQERSLQREAALTLSQARAVELRGLASQQQAGLRLTLIEGEAPKRGRPHDQAALSSTHELVIGYARVQVGSEAVAELRVALSTQALSQQLWWVWLLGLSLGALTASLVLLIPLWISRRGDERNQALWVELETLNQSLEARIEQRTQALYQLSERLLSVQEEERARLSRDLHDELGQTLTGLRLQLTTLTLLPPEARSDGLLQGLLEGVDAGVDQVRAIAYELRPPELDTLGLSLSLERHLKRRAEAAQLTLTLTNELKEEPRAELSAVIFRVVQEALTNIIRHAHAHEIWVRLQEEDAGGLLVEIEDNGRGLAEDAQEGVGLMGLRSRVREVGGEASLQASAQGGLLVRVRLP